MLAELSSPSSDSSVERMRHRRESSVSSTKQIHVETEQSFIRSGENSTKTCIVNQPIFTSTLFHYLPHYP